MPYGQSMKLSMHPTPASSRVYICALNQHTFVYEFTSDLENISEIISGLLYAQRPCSTIVQEVLSAYSTNAKIVAFNKIPGGHSKGRDKNDIAKTRTGRVARRFSARNRQIDVSVLCWPGVQSGVERR